MVYAQVTVVNEEKSLPTVHNLGVTLVLWPPTLSEERLVPSVAGLVPHFRSRPLTPEQDHLTHITEMSNTPHEIWCLVEGEDTPFPVLVPSSSTVSIGEFKQMVQNTIGIVLPAHRLILWKVRYLYPFVSVPALWVTTLSA